MTSTMDKLMQAMADSDRQNRVIGQQYDGDDAGAHLLALIRDGAEKNNNHLNCSLKWFGGGGGEPTQFPGVSGGVNSKICYDRDFLFSCSESPICREMPKALADKLVEFPSLRRKQRSSNHNHLPRGNHRSQQGQICFDHPYLAHSFGNPDHFRYLDHYPSVVSALPLRPTAQIFTWDPTVGQWVRRARPHEA